MKNPGSRKTLDDGSPPVEPMLTPVSRSSAAVSPQAGKEIPGTALVVEVKEL
jgi:hypothetical protein